jgi:hypothetical protein
MRQHRATIAAITAGVLVLASIAAFAIALPQLVGEGSAAAPVAESLPDELLDGKLVSADQIDPNLTGTIDARIDYGQDKLSEVYDADVAVQIYASQDLASQAEVTVIDVPAGALKPGLPQDPDTVSGQGAWYDLQQYGEVTCFVVWPPEAELEMRRGLPVAVQCQRGTDDRTYDIDSAGLSPEEAAAALDEVVEYAESGA